MPEGPEIRRAADEIERAITREPVQDIFFAFEHLKPYEDKLRGDRILNVQTRGKGMLIRFACQLNIYSHNQLYGIWYVRKAYDFPQTKRQLRLAIHNSQKSALLYSASDIEVLREDELIQHPFWSQVGPDVLDSAVSVEQVVARLLDPRFHRRGLVSLLLDQKFLCGLGNYLRSEVLFVAGVHPSLRPMDCTPEQITGLAEAAIALARQSYTTGGITNDLARVAQLKQQGLSRGQYRFHVFNRDGQPCWVCQTPIEKNILGGRRIYYCPVCQSKGVSPVFT
ncbi:endonuclease VIII [Thermoleptolyngbya sichuanensis A183]|uniref:DNA-(apurinic or apyrimidinic site) lyase n=1 Tax=Thermoleptolyngbya sichuanensis A183 TaxID=2737172 RepID=A0A6M8BM13_9CYAN|nr:MULTISPECIES: endonuclease VIII [Thermoleptolyngbya]MDG2615080.1 endonuclease VIII [Thermoleptolyngbya sichuanensis XZ-Cy5]QKD83943.1 endonuclease VIII [Thermoleptolyngbya sichuanensis A183]